MSEFPIRMAKAVRAEGDGQGLYCTSAGLFIGEGYALVGGSLGKSNDGGLRIRPLDEINADLSRSFGMPIDWRNRMGTLRAVAKALDDGDLTRALIAAVHLDAQPLPDASAALHLSKISAVRKQGFDPNEPRDADGRWTREGGSDDQSRTPISDDAAPQMSISMSPLCLEEWSTAGKICGPAYVQGRLGRGSQYGPNMLRCMLGLVSQLCGGNRVTIG
jgi:hypothetical protein